MNSTDHEDDELRRRFRRLAANDAESAPSVSRTLQAARSSAARESAALTKSRRRRWYVAGLVGAASAAAATVIVVRQQPTPPLVDLSTAHWVAPTDFLLNTPGRSLLRTVPGFSVTPLQASSPAALPRRTTPRNDS